jgi:hypothetical protein
MKFSKYLQEQQGIALFRGQWVSYRTLKKLIKDIVRVESCAVDPDVYAAQLWWFGMFVCLFDDSLSCCNGIV